MEVGVFRHVYVVCLCLVCILWQFSMLHDLKLLINAGRGCKRRPYGSGTVLRMSVVSGMREVGGVWYVFRLGLHRRGVDERIRFGLYQSCGNRECV